MLYQLSYYRLFYGAKIIYFQVTAKIINAGLTFLYFYGNIYSYGSEAKQIIPIQAFKKF